MGSKYNVLAIILLLIWGISYLGYKVGGFIHIFLIVAAILVLINVMRGKKMN